jgi:hypothetical protein
MRQPTNEFFVYILLMEPSFRRNEIQTTSFHINGATKGENIPAEHVLRRDVFRTGACPGEVESGSPARTCANTGIYGVSRSYGITE